MNGLNQGLKRAFSMFACAVLYVPASAQNGMGPTGNYHDAADFVAAVTPRTDSSINFNFDSAIPSGPAITANSPKQGSYMFALNCAEVVQLFISTDANAANKTLIAGTTTALRDFAANVSRPSAACTLVAGRRYNVLRTFLNP